MSFSSLFSESVSLINLPNSLIYKFQLLLLGRRILVTAMFVSKFHDFSPSLSAGGLSPLAQTDTGTNCSRVARHKWWAHQDLNLGPIDYESTALTN